MPLLLLVTVDTLRADHLGAYGSERGLTPNLDALAAQSLVFDSAYAAASFTLPSVSAILTGRYPDEIGVWINESVVPASAPTLASELSKRGWRTAAVVSNFVLRRGTGLEESFDHYDDELIQPEATRHWPERVASDTTDAALRALDACSGESGPPCFLWVHYQDPHGPKTPPAGLRERYLAGERSAPGGARELPLSGGDSGFGAIPRYQGLDDQREVAFYRAGYAGEIAYLDAAIGRLLAGVAERDLDERAVLAFAADHGESLGEDDLWFAHGATLSEPVVRIPLFLRVPGGPRGRRDDVVSQVDLLPTLLKLLVDAPVASDRLGRDLLAEGAATQASRPLLATLGASETERYGLVDGEFKLVIRQREGERFVWDGRLVRRQREGVDLQAAAPHIAAELRATLAALRREVNRGVPRSQRSLSAEDLEQLRALGYAR